MPQSPLSIAPQTKTDKNFGLFRPNSRLKMEAIMWLLALVVVTVASLRLLHTRRGRGKVPVSITYHFTRHRNYTCGFCFHTLSSSYIEVPGRAKEGLRLLAHAGIKKLNFAGGEPFLYPKLLREMIDFCRRGPPL